ncbi:hypothetical protein AVEN_184674-1 [Araneus ventricosus]|uniref:Uncharacterized protein n=1 Tax=Araneus ventricosus TaxID=182803 RepID=A0A4Y2FVQ6_ARAVE|nr:hypothetical protein AVEN_184674-1 [Araneus ventricosus]
MAHLLSVRHESARQVVSSTAVTIETDDRRRNPFRGDRKDQTSLARLASGHLKTLRFSRGDKKFNICAKCNMIEAIPQHLLDPGALVYDDLLKQPDFELEVMKANDLMDLI